MTRSFDNIAGEVKKRLEKRYNARVLEHNYVYQELLRIIKDWDRENPDCKKTDIGIAAIKSFDSGLPEDDQLANDLCKLSEMFNRKFIGS